MHRDAPLSLTASGDKATAIALPPGRFLVSRKHAHVGGALEIFLPWGGDRLISPSELVPVSDLELAERGARRSVIGRFAIAVGYRSEAGLNTDSPFGFGAALAAAYERGALRLDVSTALGWSKRAPDRYTGSELRLRVRPAVSWLVPVDAFVFRVGAGLALEPTWQSIQRQPAARLRDAGIDPDERHFGLGIGPAGLVGVALGISESLSIDLEAGFQVTWIKQTDESAASRGSFDLTASIARAF